MRRMQSDGLVQTYLEESPSGPPRKYYRLTDAGRNRLAEQVTDWRSFTQAVDTLIEGTSTTRHKPAAPEQEGETSHDA
ncbi:PadR family transcriptional regulator [Novosphingobium panipatense]